MFDFLKDNRVLALALVGTAAFLLCLVIWLAGMLGDDGNAPAPVAVVAQSGQTSQPTVTTTTGQATPSPDTEARVVNGKQLPSWVPVCAPQCPGPWHNKDFYDDFQKPTPSSNTGKP